MSLNYTMHVGKVVDEPKAYKTKNGTHVVQFTLYCDDGYGAEYLRVHKFQKTDKIFFDQADYLAVEGSLETSSSETKDGNRKWTTSIKAKSITRVDRPG